MDEKTVRKELRMVYDKYSKAYTTGDYETAASLIGDPFEADFGDGKKIDRAAFLKSLKSRVGPPPQFKVYSIKLHDDLHREGELWVVSITEDFKGRRKSRETGVEGDFEQLGVTKDYWRRTPKGWVATASHVTANRILFDGKIVYEKIQPGVKF